MGIIYILVSTYPASKRTVNKQKAKSLPPGGTVSQTPAPAQAPHPQTAPIQSPEGYADVRYGKSDSAFYVIALAGTADNLTKYR